MEYSTFFLSPKGFDADNPNVEPEKMFDILTSKTTPIQLVISEKLSLGQRAFLLAIFAGMFAGCMRGFRWWIVNKILKLSYKLMN